MGIGVRGGAEAVLAAADVFVTQEGVAGLPQLLRVSCSTLRTIKRNLGLSLAYNVIGAGLAATGLVSPLIAAILMPISSLTVVISSSQAGIPKP